MTSIERANEMRYSNRIDPFQREAARGAVKQFIEPVNVNCDTLNDQLHHNRNGNIPPGNNGDAFEAVHNLVHPPQAQKPHEEDEPYPLKDKDREDGEKVPPTPQPA